MCECQNSYGLIRELLIPSKTLHVVFTHPKEVFLLPNQCTYVQSEIPTVASVAPENNLFFFPASGFGE